MQIWLHCNLLVPHSVNFERGLSPSLFYLDPKIKVDLVTRKTFNLYSSHSTDLFDHSSAAANDDLFLTVPFNINICPYIQIFTFRIFIRTPVILDPDSCTVGNFHLGKLEYFFPYILGSKETFRPVNNNIVRIVWIPLIKLSFEEFDQIIQIKSSPGGNNDNFQWVQPITI